MNTTTRGENLAPQMRENRFIVSEGVGATPPARRLDDLADRKSVGFGNRSVSLKNTERSNGIGVSQRCANRAGESVADWYSSAQDGPDLPRRMATAYRLERGGDRRRVMREVVDDDDRFGNDHFLAAAPRNDRAGGISDAGRPRRRQRANTPSALRTFISPMTASVISASRAPSRCTVNRAVAVVAHVHRPATTRPRRSADVAACRRDRDGRGESRRTITGASPGAIFSSDTNAEVTWSRSR
jgi:hypothetical protein